MATKEMTETDSQEEITNPGVRIVNDCIDGLKREKKRIEGLIESAQNAHFQPIDQVLAALDTLKPWVSDIEAAIDAAEALKGQIANTDYGKNSKGS